MKTPIKAFCGADIFDGESLHHDKALCVFSDQRVEVVSQEAVPSGMPVHQMAGGVIAPGFTDLQVNGGGGVMFNDSQSVDTLRRIAQAHAGIGTTALLPTLITDTPERTRDAIGAVEQAIDAKVDGIAGIHIEGPHLSVARKGAHDADLIRPMMEQDLHLFLDAADRLPNVMLTVAPENVTPAQITALANAGVVVSLGHTDAGYDTCMAAFDAGARCATHLFNAMSQLGSREPGLVGAVLNHGGVCAGLIADGVHVHPATIRVALAAKVNPGEIFLVTDAMASAGADIESFTLNGRTILRKDGTLTLADGTLAGADLELVKALSILVHASEVSLVQALRMATSIPSGLLADVCGLRFADRKVGQINYIDADLTSIKNLKDVA